MDEQYINNPQLVDREWQVFNEKYLKKKRFWFKVVLFVTILISVLSFIVFAASLTSDDTGMKIFMGGFIVYFVLIMSFLLKRYRQHYRSFELGNFKVYRAPITNIQRQVTPMHARVSGFGFFCYNDVERFVDTERMENILFVGSNDTFLNLTIGQVVTVVITDKNMWGKYKKKDKCTYIAFVVE